MFGKTSIGERVVAVADIGSGSAAVALLAVGKEGPSTILCAARTVLPFENRSDDATAKGIVASLDAAAHKALADYAASPLGTRPISGAYAIIRAPWTRSKTLRAEAQLDRQSKITNVMIDDLATQALIQEHEFDSANVLESSVIRVELNGYPTGSPIAKIAHTMAVSVLISDCDPTIKSGVAETLQKLTLASKPVLRSGTRAFLSLMQDLPAAGSECVIVDVSGEGTSMVCVRDGLAESHAVISEGMRSMLARFSEKGLPEETLSVMRMIERDECDTGACQAIANGIARAEPELARVYGEAMIKIAAPRRLPSQMIVLSQADFAPWLARFFSRIDFTQFTQTSQPFSVYPLSGKDLTRFVVSAPSSDVQLDIACALVNRETAR